MIILFYFSKIKCEEVCFPRRVIVAKLSNKKLLAVAIVLSLITSMLLYKYLNGVTKSTAQQGETVIIAKVDIPPKTKITSEMVTEVKVPAEYIQPGTIKSLDKVVGIIVREQIITGEQISERRLVREGKAVGFTGMIPPDKRAVTVAVNEVTGVAGFVKAGDYIDVVATFDTANVGDNVSSVILQNILVLAANRDSDTGASAGKENAKEVSKEVIKSATVTIAVSPDEAAKVTLAEERGKIRLVLRPYLPLYPLSMTKVITPKDLVGIHTPSVKNEQPQSSQSVVPRQPVYTERQITPEKKAPINNYNTGIQVIRGTKLENTPIN